MDDFWWYNRKEKGVLCTIKCCITAGSKLATAVAGAVLMAVAINLFIVPQGLYTGGLLGLCQVIRTLLVTKLGVTANFDIAGLIYLASNVPLLLLAYKMLGGRSSCG